MGSAFPTPNAHKAPVAPAKYLNDLRTPRGWQCEICPQTIEFGTDLSREGQVDREKNRYFNGLTGGADGTRTRDPRRDRPEIFFQEKLRSSS